jgi:hypothetical protein
MTKEEIINNVKNVETTTARNLMGCSENWYDPYYCLRETFTLTVLESMSEKELNNLLELAENICNALY